MIVIGYHTDSESHFELFEQYLNTNKVEYISFKGNDIFKVATDVATEVLKDSSVNKGIIIDDFGIAPFMITAKLQGIICAQLNDEHSALMTRDHNNSNIISIGSEVLGRTVAYEIMKRFSLSDYAGGRHQIRIDMLNKMGGNFDENSN